MNNDTSLENANHLQKCINHSKNDFIDRSVSSKKYGKIARGQKQKRNRANNGETINHKKDPIYPTENTSRGLISSLKNVNASVKKSRQVSDKKQKSKTKKSQPQNQYTKVQNKQKRIKVQQKQNQIKQVKQRIKIDKNKFHNHQYSMPIKKSNQSYAKRSCSFNVFKGLLADQKKGKFYYQGFNPLFNKYCELLEMKHTQEPSIQNDLRVKFRVKHSCSVIDNKKLFCVQGEKYQKNQSSQKSLPTISQDLRNFQKQNSTAQNNMNIKSINRDYSYLMKQRQLRNNHNSLSTIKILQKIKQKNEIKKNSAPDQNSIIESKKNLKRKNKTQILYDNKLRQENQNSSATNNKTYSELQTYFLGLEEQQKKINKQRQQRQDDSAIAPWKNNIKQFYFQLQKLLSEKLHV